MSEIDQDFRPGGSDFGDASADLVDAAMDGYLHKRFRFSSLTFISRISS